MIRDIDSIPWLPKQGIPDDWVTLFSKNLITVSIDQKTFDIDQYDEIGDIREFAKQNGFYEKLDDHLHLTKYIDIDLDCFVVEWHLSFPSNEQRVAWLLTTTRDRTMEGWY